MSGQSLEQRADFGDVIAFTKKGSIEGWAISSFTRNPFSHCALMVDENRAMSLSLNYSNLFKKAVERGISKTKINRYEILKSLLQKVGLFNGTNITALMTSLDVRNLPSNYDEWVILRHKEMTPEKRDKLKKIYDGLNVKGYDVDTFLKMAYRHSKRVKPRYNDWPTLVVYLAGTLLSPLYKNSEEDFTLNEDLSVPLCSTIISGTYTHVELKTHPDIKWNRMEPSHYPESSFFEAIKRGRNPVVSNQKHFIFF